ncbi:MAG: hypothetical protein ACPLRN_02655, partial [Microgenomates group bacterium]
MREKLLFLVFLTFYLLIIIRLFLLQIVNPKKIEQNFYLRSKKILPERGKIYDRNLNPLVLNQHSYLLYIEPKKITDKLKLIKQLSDKLAIPEASLEAKIDETKYWISIVNNIDEKTKNEIENLKIDGIGFEKK